MAAIVSQPQCFNMSFHSCCNPGMKIWWSHDIVNFTQNTHTWHHSVFLWGGYIGWFFKLNVSNMIYLWNYHSVYNIMLYSTSYKETWLCWKMWKHENILFCSAPKGKSQILFHLRWIAWQLLDKFLIKWRGVQLRHKWGNLHINPSLPQQNGCHFADNSFKSIFCE